MTSPGAARPGAMRRAVLHGPGDLQIEPSTLPVPGPGEALIEIEGALTGGTTAKVFRRGRHARLGSLPLPLGHEGVGRVMAVGENAGRLKPGQRVVPANSAPCGACGACTRGMSAQCEDMVWLTGLFATHALIPARIAAHNTYALPDTLDTRTAALAENLACVLKGHDRTPAREGERVLVVGTGPMACLWVWVLSDGGADVTVVGRSEVAAAFAASFGDANALTWNDLSGSDADLIIESVGTPEAWRAALAVARPGARVHLFGGPPSDMPIPLTGARLHYDELTLTASFHHTPFHFVEALRRLAEGKLDAATLVTEVVALDDLPSFFARSDRPRKALVLP